MDKKDTLLRFEGDNGAICTSFILEGNHIWAISSRLLAVGKFTDSTNTILKPVFDFGPAANLLYLISHAGVLYILDNKEGVWSFVPGAKRPRQVTLSAGGFYLKEGKLIVLPVQNDEPEPCLYCPELSADSNAFIIQGLSGLGLSSHPGRQDGPLEQARCGATISSLAVHPGIHRRYIFIADTLNKSVRYVDRSRQILKTLIRYQDSMPHALDLHWPCLYVLMHGSNTIVMLDVEELMHPSLAAVKTFFPRELATLIVEYITPRNEL